MISLISAVNPYVAYLTANSLLNVKSSLQAISAKQLLLMSLIYALFNAGAHNIYFYLSEITNELVMNSIKMFIGDFIGAVVMLHLFSSWIYLLKKYAPGKAP